MTPFSTLNPVPEPSTDPSNGRVRECPVTGIEAHPRAGDPGINDEGPYGMQGRSLWAAREPEDADMIDGPEGTGDPGMSTVQPAEPNQACIRGVCVIGCGCLRERDGKGKSKRTQESVFISHSTPQDTDLTPDGPRGRFWAAKPTEAEDDLDVLATLREGPRKRRTSSTALPTEADWLAIAEAVQARVPRGKAAAAAVRASRARKASAKGAKVSGDPTPALKAPVDTKEVSEIGIAMGEGEGAGPEEVGMEVEGNGSGDLPSSAPEAARVPKPAPTVHDLQSQTIMRTTSGNEKTLEGGVGRGGAQGGDKTPQKRGGWMGKGGKGGKGAPESGGAGGSGVMASPGLLQGRTPSPPPLHAIPNELARSGVDEVESDLPWTEVGRRGKPTPARLTPRQAQAAKKLRDSEEEWGAKGSRENRNITRSSRAKRDIPAAAQEIAAPTSWLARTCPPRPPAPPRTPEASTAVIADGLPGSWSLVAVLQALRSAMGSVEELADLMVASVHKLPQGGWVLVYATPGEAAAFLQHANRLVIRGGDGEVRVDFHLPGAPSTRKREAEALRGRQVFAALPRELATAVTASAQDSIVRDGDEDMETGETDTHRDSEAERRRQAGLVSSWIGDEEVEVRMLGGNGGIVLTFRDADRAREAVLKGLPLRQLGLRLRCREFLPREEVTLLACKRCCGFGHPEARCPREPECRSCGEKGHSEIRGECPLRKGGDVGQGPSNSPPAPRCVACGQTGHKHGAWSCPELQAARRSLVPRPGTGRVQDRVRALQPQHTTPSPSAPEHSTTTPSLNDQIARRLPEPNVRSRSSHQNVTGHSSRAPSARPADVMEVEVELDDLGHAGAKPPALPSATASSPVTPTPSRPLNGHIMNVASRIVSDLQAVSSRLDPEAIDSHPMGAADVLSALKLAILGITELMHAIATSSHAAQQPSYASMVARSPAPRPQ